MTSAFNWNDTFGFLSQPNELFESADMVVDVADDLRVKKNITYIICGVIFRKVKDTLEVLMMQEARADCNGCWYLPAGRLEPNETLEEGMKREVEEETGIICNSDGLIAVETLATSSWFRFTFLASESGGQLKTVADKESLGAAWYPVKVVLDKTIKIHLRSSDILKLIKAGMDLFDNQNRKLAVSLDRPFAKLLCRLCVITSDKNNSSILLRNINGRYKLPVIEFSQRVWFGASVNKICKLFNAEVSVKIISCISVESYPKPAYEHDGFCLTLLCEVNMKGSTLKLSSEAEQDCYSLVKCCDEQFLNNIHLWKEASCKFF